MNSIRKEISNLIDSIKEHSGNIGTTNQIPQLELEVILKKIEKLYEKSIIYNYLNKLSLDQVSNDHKSNEPATAVEKPEHEVIAVVESVKIHSPVNKDIPEKQVIMDLFASEIPVSTDIAGNESKAIVNKIQGKSISDLKAAIGINEKFQFINELFDGNMQEYNAALTQLDTLANFDEALVYTDSLRDIYRWKDDSPVLNNFMDLLKRRYPDNLN